MVQSKSTIVTLRAEKLNVEASLERETTTLNVLNAQLKQSQSERDQLNTDNMLQRVRYIMTPEDDPFFRVLKTSLLLYSKDYILVEY